MKTVQILKVGFQPEAFRASDIPRLRGFISRIFPEYSEIHNHTENGGFRLVYPELQFKFVNKEPLIVAHGSGFRILLEIFNKIGYLEINHRRIEIVEKSIQAREEMLGLDDKFSRYRFVTPWMALNQSNFEEYKKLDPIEKEQKLNRILWGNLRALAHAFDYWIEDQDAMKVSGHFKMKAVQFKGRSFSAFTGEFTTNFQIPELLGLGKQVARGFGTVEKLK